MAKTVLWEDRKRILGMPLSFTKYEISDGRLITHKGFFRTETDEILLYRILDMKMVRTLGQKIFGVGTLTLYCADHTDHVMEIKNIKRPNEVRRMFSNIIEEARSKENVTGRELYGTGNPHNCDTDFD